MQFRQWLLEAGHSIVGYNPEGFDDDDIDHEDIANQAHQITTKSGINILRNKELASVARDSAGKVIGALYTSMDETEFSFDIVVSPDAQGQGVGTNLVNDAISLYKSHSIDFPKMKLKADVVSPIMERILTRMGWKVKQKVGGHTIMIPGRSK